MHYRDAQGHHVEIDLTEQGQFVLAGAPPRLLSPQEVVRDYTPAEERRHASRRAGTRPRTGRRHRDHASVAEDVARAALREKVRTSGEIRMKFCDGYAA